MNVIAIYALCAHLIHRTGKWANLWRIRLVGLYWRIRLAVIEQRLEWAREDRSARKARRK